MNNDCRSSSTLKVSYKLINDILLVLNNKLTVGGIFCDLEKTFAYVNYGILLLKLKFYGIIGKAIDKMLLDIRQYW
jgi:hypothetical protein